MISNICIFLFTFLFTFIKRKKSLEKYGFRQKRNEDSRTERQRQDKIVLYGTIKHAENGLFSQLLYTHCVYTDSHTQTKLNIQPIHLMIACLKMCQQTTELNYKCSETARTQAEMLTLHSSALLQFISFPGQLSPVYVVVLLFGM